VDSGVGGHRVDPRVGCYKMSRTIETGNQGAARNVFQWAICRDLTAEPFRLEERRGGSAIAATGVRRGERFVGGAIKGKGPAKLYRRYGRHDRGRWWSTNSLYGGKANTKICQRLRGNAMGECVCHDQEARVELQRIEH